MLLSIKPKYVEAIFQGKKQYEFRKTKCRKDINKIVFYASSPTKSVVGEAEIDEILENTPKLIWEQTKKTAGISKKFFNEYYKGKDTAVAYKLKNITIYDEPRVLSEYGVKQAPQSYVYID